MARTVEHEVEYPHPPEKVWRALTEPAQIGQWFMKNDFKPVVGAAYRMDSGKSGPGWRGFVVGNVLEVVPNRRLVYTWAGTAHEDANPTRVEWTLEPTAKGTRVRLVQSGFTNEGIKGWFVYHGAKAGWKKYMGQGGLARVLDGAAPPVQ